MSERVVPLDLGVRWDPNVQSAVLLVAEEAAALALEAHRDDADQRCVVLVWRGVFDARLGSPNDEAVHLHPLYDKGLSETRWAGVVEESSAVAGSRRYWSSHVWTDDGLVDRPMPTHYVILSKECTAEVLADRLEVRRIDGPPTAAACAAVTR